MIKAMLTIRILYWLACNETGRSSALMRIYPGPAAVLIFDLIGPRVSVYTDRPRTEHIFRAVKIQQLMCILIHDLPPPWVLWSGQIQKCDGRFPFT
jgi:hypothetical protein